MVYIFVPLVVLMVVGFLMHKAVVTQLRTKFPGDWEAVGKPSYLYPKSIGGNYKLVAYLYARRYRLTKDAAFVRLCNWYIAVGLLYLLCLAAIVVALIRIFLLVR